MAREITYCTPDDLLPLLTDRDLVDALDDDGDGVPDGELLTQCIDLAADEIDEAYSFRNIAVPVNPAVEINVKRWNKFLTVAHAFGRRGIKPEKTAHGEVIGTIRGLLKLIMTGKIDVPSLTASTGGTTGGSGVTVPGDGNVVDVVSEEAQTVPSRRRILS